ncbi:hypothetical protein F384_12740 [Citrobacter amalonaticus Y19]|uniref:Uncharacterized protein n=1 Tax=Citrobacter amalonaticus Y19 TaxID=1261127 RepID=A0A0F6TVP9_CITAM|nr:hypothetical protein F384_12740 [Citrobacter amalonaticus Y19]
MFLGIYNNDKNMLNLSVINGAEHDSEITYGNPLANCIAVNTKLTAGPSGSISSKIKLDDRMTKLK